MIMSEVWLCQEHTPTRSSVVHQSFTALRKLTHHREVVDGSLKRRDIIEDYNNYASQVTMSFYNVVLPPVTLHTSGVCSQHGHWCLS